MVQPDSTEGPGVWFEWRPPPGQLQPAAEIKADEGGGLEPKSLVKYVLNARVDLLAERTFDGSTGTWIPAPGHSYSRAVMARELGYPRDEPLSKLCGPQGVLRHGSVLDLEQRLLIFAFRKRGATRDVVRGLGWLASFFEEVSGHRTLLERAVKKGREVAAGVKVRNTPVLPSAPAPFTALARWHPDLCTAGPHNGAEVIVLGNAFLALLAAAPLRKDAMHIWRHYAPEADRTMRALVAVAAGPRAGESAPAIRLAARIGLPILPIVREHVERSPVGFRSPRILTRVLQLSHGAQPAWWSRGGIEEADGAWQLLSEMAEPQSSLDPYPARDFLVDALREAAIAGSALERKWSGLAIDRLEEVARDSEARQRPVRSRVHATFALHEFAPHRALRAIVDARRDCPDERAWAYLEELLVSTTSTSFSIGEILLNGHEMRKIGLVESDRIHQHRESAADPADGPLNFVARLPLSVQRGTRQLIRYALLCPDEASRQLACQTMREAGVAPEVAGVVSAVLRDADSPAWLREVAAFVLGELGDAAACFALETAAADTQLDVSVRHAALFALGDIGRRSPRTIDIALDIHEKSGAPSPVVQAATYALAVLPPGSADDHAADDQESTLARLEADREVDEITRALAGWGRENLKRSAAHRELGPQTLIWGLEPLAARTRSTPGTAS